MAKSKSLKDLPKSPAYGLKGRIVTMKAENEILDNATIYIDAGAIQAVVKAGDPVPAALKNIPVHNTKGTLFPGLIELHNHLSYNCLPIWQAPKKFGNRNQWAGIPLYQQLISGPMSILGKTPGFVEAIVRYVECKCLVAGVTTSQGIMLFSNAGIQKYYQGIVRNVEAPADPALTRVDAHIPDIAAKDAKHFLDQLNKKSTNCLLLHLSEGTDEPAHKHFESLKLAGADDWAINNKLAGIHCVALKAADYAVMNERGASMVWSPMSNLMLYGGTADIAAAKASGITIGIGSDWSPSGSKNLLGELKVAKLFSDHNGNIFSNFELISMATSNASKIIKWDQHIGTLEKGKLADLLVLDGTGGDPYEQLLHASEKDLNMVVINGTPRCGTKSLMKKFGTGTETVKIGKTEKSLNLVQEEENLVVGQLNLSDASSKLAKGLKSLKSIAKAMPPLKKVTGTHNEKIFVPDTKAPKKAERPTYVLVLDHDEAEGNNIRTHIATGNKTAMAKAPKKGVKAPAPEDIPSIVLDPLCVDSDKNYFKNISAAINLPDYIKTGLKDLY